MNEIIDVVSLKSSSEMNTGNKHIQLPFIKNTFHANEFVQKWPASSDNSYIFSNNGKYKYSNINLYRGLLQESNRQEIKNGQSQIVMQKFL